MHSCRCAVDQVSGTLIGTHAASNAKKTLVQNLNTNTHERDQAAEKASGTTEDVHATNNAPKNAVDQD